MTSGDFNYGERIATDAALAFFEVTKTCGDHLTPYGCATSAAVRAVDGAVARGEIPAMLSEADVAIRITDPLIKKVLIVTHQDDELRRVYGE